MPAEAAVSVTVKSARGDLHTLRGDGPQDFANNAVALLGVQEGNALYESVKATFRSAITVTAPAQPALQVVPDEAQAVQNVVQAFPGASTVGQPLPQPTVNTVTGEVAGGTGEPQPGEQRVINGELKKWIPAGVSKAGKPYKGFWGKP